MVDSPITTPSDVIDAFATAEVHGTAVVADGLKLSMPVVSNWRARGKIPSEYWNELVALAGARRVKGIKLSVLASIHGRRTAGAKASEARA